MTRHCRIPLTCGCQGVPAARSCVWISQVLNAVMPPPRPSSGHGHADAAAAAAYYCRLLVRLLLLATAGGMLSKPLPRWGLERLQRPQCNSCDSPPATAQVTANGILEKIPKPGRTSIYCRNGPTWGEVNGSLLLHEASCGLLWSACDNLGLWSFSRS